MTHLFWKDKEGTKNLLSSDFTSEQEFENLILNHQELLGDDIFLISSQVRGGKKKGIPDIIGVDKDENVCIVEMKNVSVTSEIIPQVLEYALWAQHHPAEIKNLWLESKEQPEEYEIDFDKEYGVRIIIVAPLIEPSTALATEKINYPVDLIEVKRWSSDTNHFFLVNQIEPPETKKPSPVRGKMIYGEEEYRRRVQQIRQRRYYGVDASDKAGILRYTKVKGELFSLADIPLPENERELTWLLSLFWHLDQSYNSLTEMFDHVNEGEPPPLEEIRSLEQVIYESGSSVFESNPQGKEILKSLGFNV